MARHIRSVSLSAGSVDFSEDAPVDVLIAVALGWSARNRARGGMAIAGTLLVPATAFLWTAWQKFSAPTPPDPWLLSKTGLGAFAVNVVCAVLLTRFGNHSCSLTCAA